MTSLHEAMSTRIDNSYLPEVDYISPIVSKDLRHSQKTKRRMPSCLWVSGRKVFSVAMESKIFPLIINLIEV